MNIYNVRIRPLECLIITMTQNNHIQTLALSKLDLHVSELEIQYR